MGSLSVRIRYRPVRIGWCVESQRLDQVQQALRFTHAFAGGRFNPVIPVDSPKLAEYLVDRFRVDLLFPLAESAPIASFVKAHPYLLWPRYEKKLFYAAWQHVPAHAAFVDVYHAACNLREAKGRRRKVWLLDWTDDDPLALPLLAMAGAYPVASPQVPDYRDMLNSIVGTKVLSLQHTDPIPTEVRTRITPSRLTGADLDADDSGPDSGVYVGDAANFEDVVNFWNIRAAGASVVFYDPAHAARLTPLLDAHRKWLGSVPLRPWQQDGVLAVYRREALRGEPLPAELGRASTHSLSAASWNGLNIKPCFWHWQEQSALGSVDESEKRPSLTFALPEKPTHYHPYLSQQTIAARG